MSDGGDQLAALGQSVIQTVIATYNPTNDPDLALSMHPGQPLADDIVQNGETNPLRLSEWIEEQYDYPLWLKRSDATSVTASSVGSVSAKSAYLAMIPWAQPSVPADSPAFARISAMIADARKDLGDNPDALPFGCEPTDFAEPGSTAWHVFDQVITTSTTTSTTSPAPAAQPARINPALWKMRVMTQDVVDRLPSVDENGLRRRTFAKQLLGSPRDDVLARVRTLPSAPSTITPDRATVAPSMLRAASALRPGIFSASAAMRPVALARPVAIERDMHAAPRLNPALIQRLATMQLADFELAPEVAQVTTTGSQLHVHFEYCLLTISRRLSGVPWWHADLIAEDDWYVPGMTKGALVPAATDAAYARFLPRGLLAVRNVSFTGTWTAEARQQLASQVAFLGPFLVRPPAEMTSVTGVAEQISVLGQGIQIIGELCSPLPPLPPQEPPAL